MEYLAGTSLALGVGVFAPLVGLDRERGFYPVVLIVIASYYVLFAVMGGAHGAGRRRQGRQSGSATRPGSKAARLT